MADHIAWLHHGARASRWGNLGLWRSGRKPQYADACLALATAVGEAAGLTQGDTVLDLACGAGEELALWVETFGAASVMALELSPSLAAQARQRAEAVTSGCPIDIHCADARHLARQVGGRFDRVLCVDALYHLGERAPLHRAARTLLNAGGSFAFTDLVLEPGRAARSAWRQAALRWGAGAAGIAMEEVVDVDTTTGRLRDAGFDEVQVKRLDAPVLDGFCAFVRWQARRLPLSARLSAGWRRVATTAWLIRTGRAAGLGYALYCGRVRAESPTDLAGLGDTAPGSVEDLASAVARAAAPPGRPAKASDTTSATTSAERAALSSSGMPGACSPASAASPRSLAASTTGRAKRAREIVSASLGATSGCTVWKMPPSRAAGPAAARARRRAGCTGSTQIVLCGCAAPGSTHRFTADQSRRRGGIRRASRCITTSTGR